MKLKSFTKCNLICYTRCSTKLLILFFAIAFLACSKTILLETVPVNSPGNPSIGEGAYLPESKVLNISSSDPIYSKNKNNQSSKMKNHVHGMKMNEEKLLDSDVLYSCPMHSEITSKDPTDRCPKCNMLINRVVRQSPSKHENMNHGGMKE